MNGNGGMSGFMGKAFPWVATAFFALLSFLGVNLYNGLQENTISIRVLAEKLSGYIEMSDERYEAAKEHSEKLQQTDQRILDRLDRSGMSR